MSYDEKIEVAEKRILELETLIQHWRSSNILSRKATIELVDSIVSSNYERSVA